MRTGVGNFFGNLSDAWSFVNNVLQAKPEGALHSFWRVVINTTIGLGGVLDPATEMRLDRHREDFGQTLGHWGVGAGPYFVLPLLGPSTLRDSVALPVDFYGQPPGCGRRASCSTRPRSTPTPSSAMPTCRSGATTSTTATRRRTRSATTWRRAPRPKARPSRRATCNTLGEPGCPQAFQIPDGARRAGRKPFA